MEDPKTIDTIQKFLQGSMRDDERKRFQQKMDQDETLAEAVAEQRMVYRAIRATGELNLKRKLQQHEKDTYRGPSSRTGIFWILVAIGLLILCWFITTNDRAGEKQLEYIAYFEPYPGPIQTRSMETSEDRNWHLATVAYQSGTYQEALAYFKMAKPTALAPGYLIDFYHAMTLMSIEPPDYPQAITLLESSIQTDHDYQEQATWYLALAFLLDGNQNRALALLEEIDANKTYNWKSAKKLIEQMSN